MRIFSRSILYFVFLMTIVAYTGVRDILRGQITNAVLYFITPVVLLRGIYGYKKGFVTRESQQPGGLFAYLKHMSPMLMVIFVLTFSSFLLVVIGSANFPFLVSMKFACHSGPATCYECHALNETYLEDHCTLSTTFLTVAAGGTSNFGTRAHTHQS